MDKKLFVLPILVLLFLVPVFAIDCDVNNYSNFGEIGSCIANQGDYFGFGYDMIAFIIVIGFVVAGLYFNLNMGAWFFVAAVITYAFTVLNNTSPWLSVFIVVVIGMGGWAVVKLIEKLFSR